MQQSGSWLLDAASNIELEPKQLKIYVAFGFCISKKRLKKQKSKNENEDLIKSMPKLIVSILKLCYSFSRNVFRDIWNNMNIAKQQQQYLFEWIRLKLDDKDGLNL